MYWSNYGLDDYQQNLTEIGFNLLETSVVGHSYHTIEKILEEKHPLIFAQMVG